MRWNSRRTRRAGLALLLLALLAPLFPAGEKRLTVYGAHGTESFTLTEQNGTLYASLPEILQSFTASSILFEKKTARMKVNEREVAFEDGSRRARFGRGSIEMASPAVVQEGRLLVPLRSLPALLAQLTGKPAEMNEPSRRLFLDQPGIRFAAEWKAEAPGITFNFNAAVNPNVKSEGNRLRLVFAKEPVVAGANAASYSQEKLVTGWAFHEENGGSELVVQGTAPLVATFSEGGKRVSIAAAPAPASAQVPSVAAPAENPPVVEGAPAGAAGEVKTPNPGTSVADRYFVMIDASHGGDEPGARLSDKVFEKEITIAFARRLRSELQARGIPAVVLHDGEANQAPAERAIAANTQGADLYIAVHASAGGKGLRVVHTLPAPQEERKGLFLPWEEAGAAYAQASQRLAQAVISEAARKKISARMISAPVAPLENVAAPSLALEICPPRFGDAAESLKNASYQQSIAASTAIALAQSRGRGKP